VVDGESETLDAALVDTNLARSAADDYGIPVIVRGPRILEGECTHFGVRMAHGFWWARKGSCALVVGG